MTGAAMAHHSVDGQFDRSDRVELNGVVSKVDWINPHIYLHLDVEEESGESNRVALVNPRLASWTAKKDKRTEGCLSIPGVEAIVQRPASVVVDGSDPEGRSVRIEAEGLFARALQHEIDHLDGVLFVDRLSPLKRQLLLKKWRKLQAEAAEP